MQVKVLVLGHTAGRWRIRRRRSSEVVATARTQIAVARIARSYAAAKSQTDGLLGLLDGLVLIQELCAAFWEKMYPSLKRPRARGNLTGWYADVAVTALANFQPTAKDADLQQRGRLSPGWSG